MPNGLFTLKQQGRAQGQGAWPGSKTPAVDYLVVAGGGGAYVGGGGGGGLLQGNAFVVTGSAITVTIGAGGATGASNGGNSVFGAITALGGGGSAAAAGSTPNSGGSGGGANHNSTYGLIGGQGTFGQGNAGGNNTSGTTYAGGGGGAGTRGLDTNSGGGGAGGAGVASDISGTRTAYAGGGGGSGSGTQGAGGVGGGGTAYSNASGGPNSGAANTGGGMGGSYAVGGGAGGSGIVIISYPDTYAAAASTTGSPTVSTSGSGSIAFADTASVTFPDAATFNFGSGDFTVEGWVYVTAAPSGANRYDIFRKWNTAPNKSYIFYINASRQLGMYYSTTGSDDNQKDFTSQTISLNTWTHIAWVKSGSTITAYVGGASAGTLTLSSLPTAATTELMGVSTSGYTLAGYLSNFRVVKGTAVYTGAFTPPTAPLSAISGTSLLLSTVSGALLADSSGNANTPTAYLGASVTTAQPTWNQLSPFATGLGYKNRVYSWTSSGSITF